MRHGDRTSPSWFTRRPSKCEPQCVGAAVHSYAEFRVAERRKLGVQTHPPSGPPMNPAVSKACLKYRQQVLPRVPDAAQQDREKEISVVCHRFCFVSCERIPQNFGGIAGHDSLRRHIFGHDTPRADDGIFTDRHLARIVEPEPIEAPCFTSVFSTVQSASVCSPPPSVVARG